LLTRISERKGHNGSIYQLIGPASDGSFLSVAGDGWLVTWPADDPELGNLFARVEDGQLFSAYLIAEENAIVAGALDGGLHWLYPDTPERNLHLAHHRKGVFAIERAGDFLYCAGGDGVLSKWSVATGRVAESLPLTGYSLRAAVHDTSRNLLYVGSSNYFIYAIDLASFTVRYQWQAHQQSVFCLGLSSDGKHLFSGGRDAFLNRWLLNDQAPPELDRSIAAHNFTINDLALSPDGKHLVTVSRDKTAKLWDAESLELLKVAEVVRDSGHVNSVNGVIWLNNERFVTASDDRRILEWSVDAFG
jgi:WD40 repeat protein